LATIRKGFVTVDQRQVHYRAAGSGPPVLLLHDSPRSSVLHIPLLEAFGDRFTAIAIDTPGYGNSDPLPAEPRPEIPDFGDALADTIAAFGVARCPVYSFHTSSKITLDFASKHPHRVAVAIMDGLSIPPGGPDEVYIANYMAPFVVHDHGGHLAEQWSKVRDFQRWFPWFAKSARTRSQGDRRDMAYTHGYCMDLFMAGANWTSAYSAAMRYNPLPAIARLKARAVFTARSSDVLYAFLDKIPQPLPPQVTIEKLGPDREPWEKWIRAKFDEFADFKGAAAFTPPDPLVGADPKRLIAGYVAIEGGQMLVRRVGGGAKRPVVVLPDMPGGTRVCSGLMHALALDRPVYVLEWPGAGESTPLLRSTPEAYVAATAQAMRALGLRDCDVVAEYLATPLALLLAKTHPELIHALALDGPMLADGATRAALAASYLADLTPRHDGGHLHACWHMLRDREVHWPWFDGSRAATRFIDPDLEGRRLQTNLVDVMKQPTHAGDAPRAALAVDGVALLAAVRQPMLTTSVERDPRHQWADLAAKLSPSVKVMPRARENAERAMGYLAFFDGGGR
jgi:pimeloyl-ACP methyl ester carboxylesterase